MPVIWGIVVAIGLEEALTAAVGALIIAAAIPLGILAANVARQLPWPIGPLATGLIAATEAAIKLTVVFSEGSANALATVIQAPWQASWTAMRGAVVAAEHLYWAVDRLRHVTVPDVYRWTWAQLVSVLNASILHADQVGQRVAAYAATLAVQAMQRADREFVQAVQHADQLAQAEARYAQTLTGQAMARADLEFTRAVQHTDQVGDQVARYAQTLTAEGLAYTQAAVRDAELLTEQVGAASIDFTRQVAGDLLQDILRSRTQSDAYARALAVPIAAAVTAIEQSPCMRACGPLGELGGLLQSLEAAGLLALLLELVAEARHHPDQVADMIRADLVGPVQGAARLLQLGIA